MSKPLAVKTDNDSPFWVGDTPSSPPAEQSTPSKQLTSPVAVDLATIERHKENIMPLKRGRSAVALAQAFSESTDTRHAQLQEQRQAFEKEISKAEELDDPLEPYYRYIKWTVNNYPQGHNHESNLVPLLEQCTRTFHRDPRYQNDPRYLRCWLLYANNVKDPTLIYKFLEANRIGQRLAAYYEEYAAYLEKQGRWRLAKEVYILGIERGAQPLERLRRKYKEFQPRMVAGEEAAQQTSSPAQRVVSRSGITRQPMAVMRDAHAGQRQPLSARGRQSSNTRLEVFSDDDNDLSQEFLIGNATPWSGVDTERGRHKENRQEPTSWRGQQLPSKIPHRIVPHDKLAVYQDEDNSEDERENSVQSLVNDPLRNFKSPLTDKKPADRSSKAHSKAKKHASGANEKGKASKTPRPERMVVDLEFVYPNGVERSFEEARAEALGLLGAPFNTPRPIEELEVPLDDVPSKRARLRPPSPTINTRAALDDVMAIFNQPLAHERLLKEEYSEDDDEDEDEYDDRVRTQRRGSRVLAERSENQPTPAPLGRRVINSDKISQTEPRPKRSTFSVFHDENEPLDEEADDENVRPAGMPHMPATVKPTKSRTFDVFQDEEDEDADSSVDDIAINIRDNEVLGQSSHLAAVTSGGHAINFEASDDITRQLEIMRQQDAERGLYRGRVSLQVDENFTLDWKTRQMLCSTPYHLMSQHSHDTNVNESLDQVDESTHTDVSNLDEHIERMRTGAEEASLVYESHVHRGKTAVMPLLTPIAEMSERSNLSTATISNRTSSSGSTTSKCLTSISFSDVRRTSSQSDTTIQTQERTTDLSTPTDADSPSGEAPILFDQQYIEKQLAQCQNELRSMPGFEEHTTETLGQKEVLERAMRYGTMEDGEVFELDLGERVFGVSHKISDQGQVYLAIDLGDGTLESLDDYEANHQCVLKVCRPANAWEAVMLYKVHTRLANDQSAIVIKPLEFYLYKDESYLVLPYNDQGTLLDHANGRWAKQAKVDEVVAAFFVCRLLQAVSTLHAIGILHGNIRPENVLVRLDDDDQTDVWQPIYDPTGAGGWQHKGICLIDFSRSIDLRQHPDGQQFRTGWHTDASDCPDVRANRSFRLNADWYGCATVVYALLYGRRLELRNELNLEDEENDASSVASRLAPREPVHKDWDATLWNKTFDRLLNMTPTQSDDEIRQEISELIQDFEDWLVVHSTHPGKSLRSALNQVQLEAIGRAAHQS